jgi:hypothetical protein
MLIRREYTILLCDGRSLYGAAHRKGDLFEALERWGIHRSEVRKITRIHRHEWQPEIAPTRWQRASVQWD